MGCGGSKVAIKQSSILNFMILLKSKTPLSKYAQNKEAIKIMDKAQANDVFGGSVLLPVGEKGKKRTKGNPFYDDVLSFDHTPLTKEDKESESLNVLKGGGFYVL